MSNPHEIKVTGCDSCPLWDHNLEVCNHPYNMYDGNKYDQWIEHCPLKERQTVITFERPKPAK
jgi:hypothetical protein